MAAGETISSEESQVSVKVESKGNFNEDLRSRVVDKSWTGAYRGHSRKSVEVRSGRLSQERQIQETVLGRDYRKESVWVSESWAATRDCRDPYQATRVSKTFGPSRSVEYQSPGPELIDLRGRCHLKSTERFASGRIKVQHPLIGSQGKTRAKLPGLWVLR